jgi:hypothetical protein
MVSPGFTSVVRRVLPAAAALTLVLFAASADLQSATALASPAVSADRVDSVAYLEDNNGNNNQNHNGNDHKDGNDNRNNDRNHDSNDQNGNNGNNGNNGGQGIFSLICSVPGFAANAGCSSGLLGS